jgi:hypothetical protein
MRRTLLLTIVAVVVVPMLVGVTPSSAFGARPTTAASGPLSCSITSGTLDISPPVSFGGTATAAVFTFSDKLKCSGTSGVTSGSFKASGTASSNDCAALATEGFPPVSGTIHWKGAQRYSPSTVDFSNGGFSLANSEVAVDLPATGASAGTATVAGSFAGEPLAVSLVADQSISTLEAGCYNTQQGLAGLSFTGVAGPSVLDVSPPPVVQPGPPVANGPVTVTVDAADPGAPVNEGLIGVNHVVAGSQAALAAIGTRWGRTDVSFEASVNGHPVYDCTTGAWNPTYLDQHVALDQQAGVTPELIVDYFPPCLSNRSSSKVRKQWKQLVSQMALHEITAEGVRIFEVWNEPSFTMPLKGPTGYLELYRDTATALEQAASASHVRIEVGGPAVDEVGTTDNTWLVALAGYVSLHDLPLDFLAWHNYPNNPDEGPSATFPNGGCVTGPPPPGTPCWYNPDLDVTLFGRGAQSVRAALAAFPTLHPLLWIDEWAVDSGGDIRSSQPYGAAFVAASLDSAQQGGVDRMSYYDVADNPDDGDHFGLLTATMSPKPSYDAFSMWHTLAGSLLPVTLTPDQSSSDSVGRVGAVASVAPDGTVNVLAYNWVPFDPTGGYGTTDPTPYDHPVTVDLSGLSGGSYNVSRTLVDADDPDTAVGSSTLTGSSGAVSFTLAGEGVTLVTLTPT